MQQDIFKRLVITDIYEEANDTKLFFLKEKGEKLDYKAGQYLTFSLPEGDAEVRRSYSIASSPVIDETLYIGVKRINNGMFSRKLVDQAQVGDELLTLGAGGLFVLTEEAAFCKELFFFAAGSGIIPIYSLIRTALYTHPHLQLILVYSNNRESTTIFYEPLKQLAAEFADRLKIEFIFSDAKNLFKAHLHADFIEQLVKEYSGSYFDDAMYYVCGPEAYMRLCTFTLRRLKVPTDNIKREIFHTTKSVQKVEPPDDAPHDVTLVRGKEKYTIRVQHPESILLAARKQGIVLPYSCEAGRCGNCIARCEEGKVWMSYNEVLTETELAQGLILTCTSYPVEGNATIRY